MKYAIFSDVHSNLEALKAVQADMKREKVDAVICLGDIVGYGPNPVECLVRVQKMKCPVVRGNHDHHAAEPELPDWFTSLARTSLEYSRSLLTKKQKKYLGALPFALEIDDFQVVHASLDQPAAWSYVLDGMEAELHFAAQKSRVSFCGHTHQPRIWQYEQKLTGYGTGTFRMSGNDKFLINVGSVGLPRDRDHRACYVIYEPLLNQVKFRRVDYNVELTKAKILKVGLPSQLAAKLTPADD